MSDRRPLCFEGRFLWHPVPPDLPLGVQRDYLPPDVFAALTGHIPRDNAERVDRYVKAYSTREAAMAALEAATATAAVSRETPRRHWNPIRYCGDDITTTGNSEGI